jgi:DnaJ-class molecular chaperone
MSKRQQMKRMNGMNGSSGNFPSGPNGMPPQFGDMMNFAKQMTKDIQIDDTQKNQMNQMIKQMTGAFTAQLDPKQREQIEGFTSGLLNSFTNQPSTNSQQSQQSQPSTTHQPQQQQPQVQPKLSQQQQPSTTHQQHQQPSAAQPNQPSQKEYQKPNISQNYEELENDELADYFQPRTKDMIITLGVSLEELYKGHEKKIAIKRERIKGEELVEERKKIVVSIEPGMRDEQIIRYNKQASEKFGHDTGDIVIVLKQNGHDYFEREGCNLFVCKNISLYESYAAGNGSISLTVVHLDGRVIKLNANGIPLHENNGHRKVPGFGMPVYKQSDMEEIQNDPNESKTHGDLFLRFNLVLPKALDARVVQGLKNYFPLINEDIIDNTNGSKDPSVLEVTMEDLTEEDLRNLEDEYSDEYSEESESEYDDSEDSDEDDY